MGKIQKKKLKQLRKTYCINADGFGLNSSIDKAIVELFKKDLISSATLLVNMLGFNEEVDFVDKYELHNTIGIHLVFTEEKPLTEEIKQVDFLFNDEASFRQSSILTI